MSDPATSNADPPPQAEWPLISTVIPVYNREALIGRAVESALAQTGRLRQEVIVVDDGSSDRTAEVLAGFGDRIELVRQENAGRSAARNAGLARARGSYVAFLDSDDEWDPNKLERQLQYHLDHPQIEASAHAIKVMHEDGVVESKLPRYDPEALRERPYETLMDKFAFFPSAVMVRREVANAVGGFCTEYHGAEDLDFILKIARLHPVGVLPECLVTMHQHGENTTKRQLQEMNINVLLHHLQDYDLKPACRAKLRRKIARYRVSVAKRATSRTERARLLRQALTTDPRVVFSRSYLYQLPRLVFG